METVLKVNGITKRYSGFTALNELYMNVPKGSIYGFVGKNGAGKTTLIRVITGLQKADSGDYEIFGVSSGSKDIIKAGKRMGAIVETPALFTGLTAVDNMKQQYLNLGLPSYDGIDELLKLVGLGDTGKKKVKNFSLGMRQRLGIAVALCGKPDLLILDEPINGLDPQGIVEMRELILKLNRENGVTILISSHLLDELSRLATHYGFIDGGKIIKEMSAAELEAASRQADSEIKKPAISPFDAAFSVIWMVCSIFLWRPGWQIAVENRLKLYIIFLHLPPMDFLKGFDNISFCPEQSGHEKFIRLMRKK